MSGVVGSRPSSKYHFHIKNHSQGNIFDGDIPITIKIDPPLSEGEGEDIVTPLSLPNFLSPSGGVGADNAWQVDEFDIRPMNYNEIRRSGD